MIQVEHLYESSTSNVFWTQDIFYNKPKKNEYDEYQ